MAGDEAISFNHYGHLSFLEILFNYPDSNQHALFSILSNACLIAFGDHEIVFRLPSLVTGVLAIPLTYCACRSLGFSSISSFASSFLLALYVPHISYSQEGRGYALTVFLGILLILSSIHILRSQCLWLWGIVLVTSATCMVITLPSNAVFVAGAFGFCLVLRILKKMEGSKEKGLDSYYWAFYVLSFFLILGYLLINLNDIQVSAEANLRGGIRSNFRGIAEFLVAPWGLWLYLFFIVGFFSEIERHIRYSFLALFIIPVAITLASGIVGFSRIYIYFAPFVLMFVSIGFVFLCQKIMVINKKSMYGFLSLALFWTFSQPILALANYYPNRLGATNGYIRDAIKLQEWVISRPFNTLPIIMNSSPGHSILNHYLGESIWQRMNLYFAGKKIEKIILLCKKGTPPNKYAFLSLLKNKNVSIPKTSIKLVESFDSFQVFEWHVTLSQIGSGKANTDHESSAANIKSEWLETYAIKNPRAVGHSSLLIKNLTSSFVSIKFPVIFNVDMGDSEGFVLNLYLNRPNQKAFFRAELVDKDASKISSVYLNPYLNHNHSYYKNNFGDEKWEMVLFLTSVGKGKKMLQESIHTLEKTTILDGLQSYIIKPEN